MNLPKNFPCMNLKERFRGFLPVVIDVETAGVDPYKNALLEMCIVLILMDEQGNLYRGASYFEHILPFHGAELDEKSLEFNQIDPYQPLRFAIDEKSALENLFKPIFAALKKTQCQRAVLVGHNAWFDLLFIKEAIKRTGVKSPFHAFTCFDTATLGGFIFGQTVLAKAAQAAGIQFDAQEAHSAIYDAEKTADLFCHMVNLWKGMREKK
ncbi:ribonuclease T [Fluoribacter dumoffii]|uniref:Ribonuclease T n=1 Tax=Fluoribacter dumoffii TaxID=463 RepID=A0A377G654_9GAMM|nr:ribonuclease T [Fluoribacter dumoffii]KTC91526.1 ribonuclease T [Fluoribacter dumoffii NY 23]MCW8387351.1 ribonuclease T [Fluoribacter dumoffii]MCW8417142.1 ribonuclease T [Fluoribacter dumoffii]MCW8455018.1 ribonuclease T [Fluoribacter dumoffii]MCW8460905.1 ribonuclease T [Fluoribacter dumoffii]